MINRKVQRLVNSIFDVGALESVRGNSVAPPGLESLLPPFPSAEALGYSWSPLRGWVEGIAFHRIARRRVLHAL